MIVGKFVIVLSLLAPILGVVASISKPTPNGVVSEKGDACSQLMAMASKVEARLLDMGVQQRLAGESGRQTDRPQGKNMTENHSKIVTRNSRRDKVYTGNVYVDYVLLTLIGAAFTLCASAFGVALFRMIIYGPTGMAPVSVFDGWIPIYAPRRAPGGSG